MATIARLRPFLLLSVFVFFAFAGVAQGPPGHDPDNPPPGHGGIPPGQAKKHGHGEKGMPPGQAKKYADYRFRDEDRIRFYAHYRHDADSWHQRRRPVFVPGHVIVGEYEIQPVPRSFWVEVMPPPPPGYLFGYCGGYVVAYDPTTRMVADVLDLVRTAASR